MNRTLHQIQQKLGMIYRPIIIILLSLGLFILGYASVKPVIYNIRANEVADVTIRAPYTTIDEYRTKENKQRARDSVADIYSYRATIREEQLSLIEQYFSTLRQLKKEKYSTKVILEWAKEMPNTQSLIPQVGVGERTDTQEVQFAQLNEKEKIIVLYHQLALVKDDAVQMFANNLNDAIHLSLLSASDKEVINIQKIITNVVSDKLGLEIPAERVEAALESATKEFTALTSKQNEQQILEALAVQLIVPTVLYDKNATEAARENAANQVQSSYILQGQVIVQEGFVADAEMIRILNIYGILNKQTPNYSVYAFVAVLFIHAIFLYVMFARWDNKQVQTVKDGNMRLTAYALVFLVAFTVLTGLQFTESNGMKNAVLLFPASLIPVLILPKTDRRTSLLSVIFFSLISLFFVNRQTDTMNLLLTILFYFYSMLTSMLRIEQDETLKNYSFRSSVLWHIVVIVPVLLVFKYEFLKPETMRIVLFMFMSVALTHIVLFLIKPYWEQLLDDQAELTLNQLANLNHPLLKRLIESAPGSYHHSILVANLSANAVEAIGGNSLLTRVASYYHDVGKIKYPLFFVENLSAGMVSPHQMVSSNESAKIIIDHVNEGIKLLNEYKMPKSIIDVCAQHHGTTRVEYFYYQAKKQNVDVDISEFTYPGPIPQSKEIAIIMLADSVEAASRSLKEYSLEAIEGLVSKIINNKIEANQFVDCGLTVHELKIVKQSLVNGVAGMFHTRVEYPE
ncbi:HDIG domain-containing protein [Tuanshanicoccus lijuaniae]|uniref:HD family phosphohydrolase n=1 Tax=Aerococcaceae bacterium zg-1292 TaxID=2774330 RepID=UPI001936DEDB|nr:HDIG domain-containing protein [Aerococcaceae bacterium zg-1292]QQA38084.1 HDIG domain-containing protein [Aerococcaceae bacterium zg-1292]